MGLYENITFKFISPEELQMPEKVTSFLKENNIPFEETTDYPSGIKSSDVIYVTRLQRERFTDISEPFKKFSGVPKNKSIKKFILTKKIIQNFALKNYCFKKKLSI
jgi:aspartate carbamoyltransferase catalytic subunit